jgi:hypothetical protein
MDELEKELSDLGQGENWLGGGLVDRRQVPALLVLTKAVIRLDKSSTLLARVNIVLGIIVIGIGILQVVVMLRGH